MKNPTERTMRFFRAAEQGHFHVAKMLVESGVDVNARGADGATALHAAAGDGQTEMVDYLLPLMGKGEVDVRDELGNTPLHWAARSQQADVARMLLEHGANPMAVDTVAQTPLHRTVRHAVPATPPREAGQDCQIAQMLLEAGAKVDARDSTKRTPLHAAANEGQTEMTKMLLGAGAQIDAKDAIGNTPLHLAAEGGFKDVVRVLLEQGAAVNSANVAGRTALHSHLAARQRSRELVQMLVSKGADVNAADKKGRTVLHEAAQRNPRDPMVELLRKAGARETTPQSAA